MKLVRSVWVKLFKTPWGSTVLKLYFGVWLSLARALGLGPRGPEFESLYPDYFF